MKWPIGKKCTDYYALSRGGEEGLIKYPIDKVPVVFTGEDEIMYTNTEGAHRGRLVNK